jgi:hypothetical protein
MGSLARGRVETRDWSEAFETFWHASPSQARCRTLLLPELGGSNVLVDSEQIARVIFSLMEAGVRSSRGGWPSRDLRPPPS